MQQQSLEQSAQDRSAEILPATQHILESYPELSVLEKNTLYRTPEGELSLHIYPKLPVHQ